MVRADEYARNGRGDGATIKLRPAVSATEARPGTRGTELPASDDTDVF